ncbi:MAG: GspMb/PilO family protein [Gemmatimonadaceae bacterium]
MKETKLAGLMPSLSMRPQDRRALLLGAAALALMLGYSRVARPAVERLRERERNLTEQRALLARERALLAVAPSLPGRQAAADRVIVAEDVRLFAGDSVGATAELTAYVADIANDAGVRLASIEARAPTAQRGVTRLLVDARGEGPWSKVLDFVAALEGSEHLADVTSVRIERGARGGLLGGAPTVSVVVTVAGFSRATP